MDHGLAAGCGSPVVAPGVRLARGSDSLPPCGAGGEADVDGEEGLDLRDSDSYGLNS